MRVHFTENEVMQVIAECDVESMALKYWLLEYAKHGDKVLEVLYYDPNRVLTYTPN